MSFGNLFVFSLGGVAGGLSPECGLVREEELGCWNCIKKINKIGEQGEWEGNTVDIVLGAMRAFPDAAFLGITHLFLHFTSLY